MPNSTSEVAARELIRARAVEEGFDVVRFAPAHSPEKSAERLSEFIAHGRHGDMGWMVSTAERRADPSVLWPQARSIIVLGLNYAPDRDPLAMLAEIDRAAVSVYASGDDYHDVVKKKLKSLAGFIASRFSTEVKLFVDTAPVMEKPIAALAGAGWQGKHTNLVSRDFGSWLFLGSIFTTLVLEPDEPEPDRCGSCQRCLDVCPTNAFPQPYVLDARRCIAYLTIEHKGHIAREFRAAIGNRIYGCDDCLAVCPWNKFAAATREIGFKSRAELSQARLADLVELDEASFREVFRGSSIKRLGHERFLRNVLIAIGNTGGAEFAPHAEARLQDASPLVRAMAVWALSRLVSKDTFARARAHHAPRESDAAVSAEWQEAERAH